MYTSNAYDRRRRRRPPSHPSPFSSAASVATAAALAYGAYRLGSYVWNSYHQEDGYYHSDDDMCECHEDPRDRNIHGDTRCSYRSRRSRGDWSEFNHRQRSHRPPPQEGNDGGNANNLHVSSMVRNGRLVRCRTETTRAMMDFLPTLKKTVAKLTDVGLETEQLKLLRVQRRERNDVTEEERTRERELWNAIKNKSVTRLVTTVYAHTIVFLVLTVQVNLLGGRLLREEGGDEVTGLDRYRSSHQIVLAKTYNHIFANGIPSLVEAVSTVVETVVQGWDVLGSVNDGPFVKKKDCVSLQDISSWMEKVRDEIELRPRRGISSSSALARFIIPEEDKAGNNQDGMSNNESSNELAKYILDETYDLLESPTFANSERSCLDATFAHLQNNGYVKLFDLMNNSN